MKSFLKFTGIFVSFAASMSSLQALDGRDIAGDFHQLQQLLNSSLLDVYEGSVSSGAIRHLDQSWQTVSENLTDPVGQRLGAGNFLDASLSSEDLARDIGSGRSLMQHLAALEMLQNQHAGNVDQARLWRDLITLPEFANADEGGLLLQQTPDQVRQPGVTRALAREYIGWQVARTRQLLDRFQRALTGGNANPAFVAANEHEILTLAWFPQPLIQAAGLKEFSSAKIPPLPFTGGYNTSEATKSLTAWCEQIESALPNLLTAADADRLQRLLARFVDVVPKEYHNGVQDGIIIIPLEYREAVQFTQQAQSLVNELGPVWERDRHDSSLRYYKDLVQKLAVLAEALDQVRPFSEIASRTHEIQSLLKDRFDVTARKAGEKGHVVEETVLEVRSSLNNSLAAAQAGHWQEAENLRLDAYTAFDSEIEVRVLPRNPALATRTERSFLDGNAERSGIKALLDQHPPLEEVARGYKAALENLEECTAVLQLEVSPTTIGFTTFTIIAREGMEAIIILTALLAGLRGNENQSVRRLVSGGALFGALFSLATFWLSQTIVQSLVRYGEKLEAVISVLAVIILFMVTNWVFHKFYWVGWNSKLRNLSKAAQQVRTPRWEMLALLGVGFLTVYREGFETTVFMQSLLLEGGKGPVVLGVGAGFLFIATVGSLIFLFGVKLPFRKLLIVTGILVVSIMVTFLGSTVRLFQTVGWLPVHPVPSLEIPSWAGLWLGIYPSWEGLLIPPIALLYVAAAWLWVRVRFRRSLSAVDGMPGAPELPRFQNYLALSVKDS